MTHICVANLTIIGSDNGLSPVQRQTKIWTSAAISSFKPLGMDFREISLEIKSFSFKEMRLKVSSAKQPPFCLGLNVLNFWPCLPLATYLWTSVLYHFLNHRPCQCQTPLQQRSLYFDSQIIAYISKSLIDDKSALVLVMAWHWINRQKAILCHSSTLIIQ